MLRKYWTVLLIVFSEMNARVQSISIKSAKLNKLYFKLLNDELAVVH